MKTALYRHFDALGGLIYVGISRCAATRTAQHAATKDWFGYVIRIEITWYETREEAEDAERIAIKTEKPRFNVAYTKAHSENIKKAASDIKMIKSRNDAQRDKYSLFMEMSAAEMDYVMSGRTEQSQNVRINICRWMLSKTKDRPKTMKSMAERIGITTRRFQQVRREILAINGSA